MSFHVSRDWVLKLSVNNPFNPLLRLRDIDSTSGGEPPPWLHEKMFNMQKVLYSHSLDCQSNFGLFVPILKSKR